MKVISSIIFVFALFAYIWPQNQTNSNAAVRTDDWIRVVSNDGEFSIEVPSKHAFLSDSDGFEIAKNNGNYDLKNMYMLTAFVNGTLVSFEAYDGSKSAFDAICDNDAFDKNGRTEVNKNIGKTKIKEITNSTDKYYSIRKFINTKSHIYVLTGASRTGETKEMTHFFDSLVLNDGLAAGNNGVIFSAMERYTVKIEYALGSSNDDLKSPKSPADDPSIKPAVVVRGTRGSYSPLARQNKVQGYVILRLVFGPDGSIPAVTVVKTLPDGMLRQTIFAALRTKFLPKEKDGNPVPITKVMEFGYNINEN